MNAWRLLRAIGEIDDALIEQAESYRRRRTAVPWLAAAACFVLVLGAAVWRAGLSAPPASSSEPALGLTVLPSAVTDTGMGLSLIHI